MMMGEQGGLIGIYDGYDPCYYAMLAENEWLCPAGLGMLYGTEPILSIKSPSTE